MLIYKVYIIYQDILFRYLFTFVKGEEGNKNKGSHKLYNKEGIHGMKIIDPSVSHPDRLTRRDGTDFILYIHNFFQTRETENIKSKCASKETELNLNKFPCYCFISVGIYQLLVHSANGMGAKLH